jgi:hypothetical protein
MKKLFDSWKDSKDRSVEDSNGLFEAYEAQQVLAMLNSTQVSSLDDPAVDEHRVVSEPPTRGSATTPHSTAYSTKPLAIAPPLTAPGQDEEDKAVPPIDSVEQMKEFRRLLSTSHKVQHRLAMRLESILDTVESLSSR